MRISDWSSDVCSSDLCHAFTSLVRDMAAPCTLTLMGLGAFPADDPLFLGMLGMHGTLEANLAMHHADLIICVGARFDDRITGRLSDFRSEEHTSELQSLMRISYAVFCLKKKKTQQST